MNNKIKQKQNALDDIVVRFAKANFDHKPQTQPRRLSQKQLHKGIAASIESPAPSVEPQREIKAVKNGRVQIVVTNILNRKDI